MCCYNNTCNTLGIGDAVPAGANNIGSGDKFGNTVTKKPATKKEAKKLTEPDWKDRPNIVYTKK